MSDGKDEANGGQETRQGKTLSLRRTVESGQVRQSFSHGRSRAVVVEKKRKRTIIPGRGDEAQPAPVAEPEPVVKKSVAEERLSKSQQEARLAAVADSKVRAVEETKRRAEEEARRAEEEALRAEARALEEAEQQKRREALAREKEREVKKAVADEDPPAADMRRPASPAKADPAADAREVRRPAPAKSDRKRREGRLTINNALNEEERMRSLASIRRRRERDRRQSMSNEPMEKISRTVVIPDTITIQELANRMAERAVDVIKTLMQQGIMAKINDTIDSDTAQLIAEDLGHSVKRVSESDIEEGVEGIDDREEDKSPRPPVITVMGHVDHGKTSLLDAIRNADVVRGEAGGITQHIGAYQVKLDSGIITFIDTPGHAAFTSMRARGAKVTDIVILVVAADDGVMPQTVEAINHARAAGAPIIVAINKMDKPDANPSKVKNDLLQYEVICEEMGGDVQMIPVSAHSGEGLDVLLDAVLLQAEIMDLKANSAREGSGFVIEAQLDTGRGPVATVLVQRGTLKVGDIFVVGQESGRVRALIDDRGQQVQSAGPSMPVEVLGSGGVPRAGDVFNVVESEAQAREVAAYRARKTREDASARGLRTSLDQMMTQLKDRDVKEVALIVKGDVQGSVEAISQAADKLGNDEIRARVIHAGVGGITESDITLASTSTAIVVGFNVRANVQARQAAEQAGIEIRYYNVIYDLVDDIRAAMGGMLSPDLRETMLGNAEVLEVFSVGKNNKAAGCLVREGLMRRGAKVRLIRDDVVIHEGELSSLRRFKDEVKEVPSGQECGMAFEKYSDLKKGDVIECYEVEAVARTLEG